MRPDFKYSFFYFLETLLITFYKPHGISRMTQYLNIARRKILALYHIVQMDKKSNDVFALPESIENAC